MVRSVEKGVEARTQYGPLNTCSAVNHNREMCGNKLRSECSTVMLGHHCTSADATTS